MMPVLSDNKGPIDGDGASYPVNNFRLRKTQIHLSCAQVLCMASHSSRQLPMRTMSFSSFLNLLERKLLTTVWTLKLLHLSYP